MHVLLVEDSPGDASLIRAMFAESQLDLDLRCVATLAEARAAVRERMPDLVLTDLSLPDATGMEALDALLESTPSDVPVVVLTGDTSEATGAAVIGRGAHDFLSKSDLTQDGLVRCVQFALTAHRGIAAVVRMAGGTLRGLFGSSIALAFVDAHGTLLEVNARFERLTGWRRAAVVGSLLSGLCPHRDRAVVQASFEGPASSELSLDTTLTGEDGRRIPVRLSTAAVSERGSHVWAVLIQDLSAQRAAEADVRLHERLLEAVGEAVLATDPAGRIGYVNAAAERLLQEPADALIGRSLATVLRMDGRHALGHQGPGEQTPLQRLTVTRTHDGEELDLHITLTPTADAVGALDGWIAVVVDVTERTGMQRQLVHQGLHDSLTGLANRALLMRRLRQVLAPGPDRRTVGLLFVDLDNFKTINDTYGHDAGDEVLVAVADILTSTANPGDTVARLGGDEFVVCCEGLEGPEGARRLADEIVDALRHPFGVAESQRQITMSIGVAVFTPDDDVEPHAALQSADAAMYEAKRRGRGGIETFDEQLRGAVARRVQIREALLDVVESQFDVHYQPQIRLSTGALVGFEALLRWHHPTLGTVGPDEFIPIAEETGLILPLGRLVIERACAQLAAWQASQPQLTMSVNISARQLTDATLVPFVGRVLRAESLDPRALCLEITETVLMEDAEDPIRSLHALKGLHVKLAIDDFGTGYSSLAYLRRLPLDQLKIDREFVSSIDVNQEDAIIVASLTRLAESLGLDVIGEGVETPAQRDELAALGCGVGQGHLWSHPLPAADLEAWVTGDGAPDWQPAQPGHRRSRVNSAVLAGGPAREQPDVEPSTGQDAGVPFAELFDLAGTGIVSLGEDGTFVQANSTFCDMVGFTEAELLEMDLLAITHPDDRRANRAALAQLVMGVTPSIRMETRLVTRDGHVVWIDVASSRDVDVDAASTGRTVAFIRDITARKRAELLVTRSESLQRAAGALARVGGWAWDVSAGTGVWSEEAQRLLGYDTQPTIEPQDSLALLDDADRDQVLAALRRCAAEGAPFDLEVPVRTPAGARIWMRAVGEAERDTAGSVIRVVGAIQDITEQRNVRTQLLEREARLAEQAAVLDKARDAIRVSDLDGRVTYVNASTELLYGWPAEELIGESSRSLIHAREEEFEAATAAVTQNGEWHGDLTMRERAGEEILVQSRWTLVHDDDGQPRSILKIDTDITERRNLEVQLLRAQRLDSIGAVAGGIAHDLNNVLTPIMMSLDLLRSGETDPQRMGLIDVLASSTRRGADTVKKILSFASGVDGQRMPVDVEALVDEVLQLIDETFMKSVRVVREDTTSTWQVLGDPTQLQQVLLNLCVNARDAMPDGGTLRVGVDAVVVDEQYAALGPAATPGRYVCIRVEDDGIGMTADVLDRVFEPFYTTKAPDHGTGLGLSVSMGVVRSHGGFIQVVSTPGHGSRFRVHLPAVDTTPPAHDTPAYTGLPTGRGQRVLIVDDEAHVRAVLRQALETFGYAVLEASDGAEAVRSVARDPGAVEAVLTDMMMPGMDGLATVRALRSVRADLPIIAMSGAHSHKAVSQTAELGVHFLPKPCSISALLHTLGEIITDGA